MKEDNDSAGELVRSRKGERRVNGYCSLTVILLYYGPGSSTLQSWPYVLIGII
jgi:hypothetical protein